MGWRWWAKALGAKPALSRVIHWLNDRVLIKVQYRDLAVVLLNLQPIKPEAIVLAVRKPTPSLGLTVTKHRALNGGGADVAHRGELLSDPDACSGGEC